MESRQQDLGREQPGDLDRPMTLRRLLSQVLVGSVAPDLVPSHAFA
jgi:hypothetical protein